MKFAFLLSVFNKVDDLLAHLDILKYCPIEHEVIIAYLHKDMPLTGLENYHCIYVESTGFHSGTLLSLVAGVRKAHEMGIDVLCYRNADDWLFNYELTASVLDEMKTHDCAAYNWFSTESREEFAMNELFVRVDKFAPTADKFEKFFYNSDKKVLCEWKIAKWINDTTDKIYRIPGRERNPGIGHEAGIIRWYYRNVFKQQVPLELWEQYEVNNRYYNKEWQLIGSHDNRQRYLYWNRLKTDVVYSDQLCAEYNFSRWLTAAKNGSDWNMPVRGKRTPKRLIRKKR